MPARLGLLWPLLSGALYALTFAQGPLPGWALPWTQLITLSLLSHWVFTARSMRQAAGIGFVFGLGAFALGLYWLTISMHVYGGMALPLAWMALLLFAAYLALFPALAALTTSWLLAHNRSTGPGALLWKTTIWAAAWCGTELLRANLFTGFPWLATAYGQTDGWLAGWSVLAGAPGTTFITAWIAGAIATTLAAHAGQQAASFTPKRGIALALAIVLAFVGAALQQSQFTQPSGEPLVVRLVQGNVDQDMKFDPVLFANSHSHHINLAKHRRAQPSIQSPPTPDLILMPETVIARLSHQVPTSHWQDWIDVTQAGRTVIMLGVAVYDAHLRRYTNSILALTAEESPNLLASGQASGRYDKQHLVPFGEYVPTGFRWFINLMRIPLGDFDTGKPDQAPIAVKSQLIAPNICYEDIFGDELLPGVRAGATILANFSNLGWFGNSSALGQHWQMARFRAMETRRPMLRATNTGVTGAIDPSGREIARLPVLTAGYLDVQIQGHGGLTPYAKWGNLPTTLIVCCILLAGLLLRLRPSHG